MYADSGMLLSFSQGFFPEVSAPPPDPYNHHHHLRLQPQGEELLRRFQHDPSNDAISLMGTMFPKSTISEYNLGGEGDLFSAPEPIIETPVFQLDPMSAAMSIISGGDDVMAETVKVAGMESIQEEDQLLSDIFYECKKDLLANSAIGEPFSELSDIKIPTLPIEDVPVEKKIRSAEEGPIQRSISTGCLNSMDWANSCTIRPNFIDFQGLDFEAAFGMRRAFSEGDIKTLENTTANIGNTSTGSTTVERQATITDVKAEERREKLSRYRRKKTKRNFGRKIKYACRKALADSQPRVRGRFAKTEDYDTSKLQEYIGNFSVDSGLNDL